MIRKIFTGAVLGVTLSGFALLGGPFLAQPAAASCDCYGPRLTCYALCRNDDTGCRQICDGAFNECYYGGVCH